MLPTQYSLLLKKDPATGVFFAQAQLKVCCRRGWLGAFQGCRAAAQAQLKVCGGIGEQGGWGAWEHAGGA